METILVLGLATLVLLLAAAFIQSRRERSQLYRRLDRIAAETRRA